MIEGVVGRMVKARKGKGITREEMAFRLGCNFSSIGRWETGGGPRGLPVWAVAGYARVTDVPVAELLGENATPEAMQDALLSALAERLGWLDRDLVEVHRMVERVRALPESQQG